MGRSTTCTGMLLTMKEPKVTQKIHETEFFPIRISSLRLDTLIDFDLYLQEQNRAKPILYRERDLPFDEEAASRLRSNGVEELHVSNGQAKEYKSYIERNLKDILNDPNLPMSERSALLYHSSIAVVKDILEDPRAQGFIQRGAALVENAVSFVFTKTNAFKHLLDVTSFDYYTYTHCVNVFVFSISLARKLGYSQESVRSLGNGALLHDVGKCQIDPAIVNARGKLTADQFEQMKNHPPFGYRILQSQGITDKVILDIVRHHHEKLTGRGYPDGLGPDAITREVRICTIADIFDALTTRRSYKAALPSFPALRLMRDEMVQELDPDIFRTFVGMMGNPSD